MRKIKLFMMLALLVAGVSGAWADDVNYAVIWDHSLPNAGYTLKTTTLRNANGQNRGTITSGPNETVLKTTRNNGTPLALTNDNINTYVQANTVTDYTSTVYINSGGEIVIKYVYSGPRQTITWTDGPFEYSTYFIRSSCSEKMLPVGEVAVRLNLNDTEEFTDIVSYTDNGGYYSYDIQNKNGDQLGHTVDGVTYASDDDGDGANASYSNNGNTYSAQYKCLGQLDNTEPLVAVGGVSPSTLWFYERTHKVKVSKVTSVTIPETVVHDGVTYKVTAIQKFGFCYTASAQTDLDYCNDPTVSFDSQGNPTMTDGQKKTVYNNINDHRNDYLTSVDFGLNSNVTEIGDYAFESCKALESITLPWTITYLGVGAFMSCTGMESVTFQECPDYSSSEFGTTRIRTIENWTFWFCTGLKTVYIADGVTRIEGLSYGASFQYLPQLTYIRLPNTLTYIGPHFLCSCTAIQKVTIPASVTYIDGACFHGCESLEEVYLLGAPADIQATFGTGNGASNTFAENHTLCGSHVNTCTFYVRDNYLNNYTENGVQKTGYTSHAVWSQLNENGSTTNGHYGNYLLPFPSVTRDFEAGKWVSVIFPQRVNNAAGVGVLNRETTFGEGTLVAKMTRVRQDATQKNIYHLTFTELPAGPIPAGVPLMLKPGDDKAEYVMYDGVDQAQEGFTDDMNNEHRLNVKAENDEAVVSMKGKYVNESLKLWDFVFKASGTKPNYTYSFRKLVKGKATAAACRCWWTIYLSGVPSDSEATTGNAKGLLDSEDVDGIDSVPADPIFVIDAIYDVQGRRVNIEQSQLPQGMYIMNGKKIVVK